MSVAGPGSTTRAEHPRARSLGWYARRLASMGPAEVAGRARDLLIAQRWRRRQIRDSAADDTPVPSAVRVDVAAPPVSGISPAARTALLASADELLAGRWQVFDRLRDDMAPAPDWHLDPRTGRTAPRSAYCFGIDHRDESVVGNVKYVWEPSRHTSCTVLAAAYRLTGREPYAHAAAAQLRSWWDNNPFLSGIHWTSGIELGLRLIAWVWTRRLLADWPGVTELFEGDPRFLRQLHHHQEYLATFTSRGSSANNHVIAEAAGQFTAATAFGVFPESARWRQDAARVLRRELPRQVFACGVHRELATEYHGFVLELALVAAIEGEVAGHPLGDEVWEPLRRMTDALAAVVDERMRPPRQGDADEGQGLLVDSPDFDRWSALLATGERLFGALPWWPEFRRGDVRTAVLAGLIVDPGGEGERQRAGGRPAARPSLFADAGQVMLRDLASAGAPQLWCRFDAGPHGYLGIAAHAHADALSVEVREGGVEILTDPGTYCYHGEPGWRTYFRSTAGHNTLELDGVDQSVMGGPFLWASSAGADLLAATGLDDGPVARAVARHDGYRRLRPAAIHHRTVTLDRIERSLTIADEVVSDGAHTCRLMFHLGPDVACTLTGASVALCWSADATDDRRVGEPGSPQSLAPRPMGRTSGRESLRTARMDLPSELTWSQVRGETDPKGGWYAPGFDRRVPATTLVGTGTITERTRLVTTMRFTARARSRSDAAAAYSNHPTT